MHHIPGEVSGKCWLIISVMVVISSPKRIFHQQCESNDDGEAGEYESGMDLNYF